MAEVPSETVFVGDVPMHLDDAGLTAVFSPYGTIKSHKLLAPGNHGKRAVIITFNTVDEATWIVNNLNGNIPQGLAEPITVNFKKPSLGKGAGAPAAVPGWGAPYDAGAGGPVGDVPSENVFVGELPATMDDAQLRAIFGAYGTITSHKLLDTSQFGKRAAVISFGNVSEAQWIVNNLNGNIPQGLAEPIKVNFKRPNAAAGGKGGYAAPAPSWDGGKGAAWDGGKGAYGGKGGSTDIKTLVDGLLASGVLPGTNASDQEGTSVYVGGLPRDCTDKELYQVFSVFGPIAPRGLKAMPGDDGYSACRGYGFVNFLDAASANKAVATLSGTSLPDGSSLRVSINQGKGKSKGKY
eukprot:TRINITY_DN16643_c0_g2_i1.p1 TRINITY_DN16643_c0_g2~~TRINITY_DN16643_c0_g2_i1.p1  ORF type:complete len:352 (-),score=90.10 TRINITY_DN16643_c0_g2_i1:99-1154(-)